MKTIGRLAVSLVVVSAFSLQLSAQERDRSPDRIGMSTFAPLPKAPQLGPFTLETPQLRGEIIRLSVPVGEYVSRLAHGLSAAKRRRQEAAARRRVEADLKAFAERQRPKQ